MAYRRILTVQDISCVGQCSLTVALPVLSACGLETSVLPSALLSTHTGGFTGFTFHDLTPEFDGILSHWKNEGIMFDALYTGYLGSTDQIEYVKSIAEEFVNDGGKIIVDPAMADFGKLYSGFDLRYAECMKALCACADVILPNITEACILTGKDYSESFTESEICAIASDLVKQGTGAAVLTGIGFDEGSTGVYVFDEDGAYYYSHRRYPKSFHGTGDVYSSVFAGALVSGRNLKDSARIAADFTLMSIDNTAGDDSHWYGVKFEPVLSELKGMIEAE